ncbi:MAG: cation diffusion facilitator family transporter [Anaerolineae bacterium]|nr:cation diffusion facilitator family transporter [Anaerolineae bacterium]NIN99055.1 cation diffusion facilitator family transporter [Anaerolineae bacterium]NIQ81903.1 cation diffusion facilitator family transporter [Anaerolineae bacterium]
MNELATEEKASTEKTAVALSSVLAAVLLTVTKTGIGIWTGSLGILAEAAHSGLDLIAAVITYGAVRISDKPADARHPYGHGKVENLSALAETLLLLITCVWIIYEAINRLFFKEVHIDANLWAFGVVALSIIVDINRSKALRRVAEKHDSQALQADALHFSTDIWSSAVVMVGLFLVKISEWIGGLTALANADAIAALGVALLVIYVSLQLGKRSVDVLLDTAPAGVADQIREQVDQLEGVSACQQVRVRRAGAGSFTDIFLKIDGDTSFERAHEITARVEELVRNLVPRADVVVHYEPGEASPGLVAQVRSNAHELGASAHSIWAWPTTVGQHVELHLEVSRNASLEEAHDLATRLEARVKEARPDISEVVAHIEPVGDAKGSATPLGGEARAEMEAKIVSLVDGFVRDGACHHVAVWQEDRSWVASLHCSLSPELSIQEAHDLSERMEMRLLDELPLLTRVVIHIEPPQ